MRAGVSISSFQDTVVVSRCTITAYGEDFVRELFPDSDIVVVGDLLGSGDDDGKAPSRTQGGHE